MSETNKISFPNEGLSISIRTVTKIEITNNENGFPVFKEVFIFDINETSINYSYTRSYYSNNSQNVSFNEIYYWDDELKHFITHNISSSSAT